MFYRLAAELVILVHFLFLVFVVVGGLLALRWRWLVWLHLPAVLWGAVIGFTEAICPLTPLEKYLRGTAGGSGYPGGFINHYITPVVYPGGLTESVQVVLGVLLVMLNLAVYGRMVARWKRGSEQAR